MSSVVVLARLSWSEAVSLYPEVFMHALTVRDGTHDFVSTLSSLVFRRVDRFGEEVPVVMSSNPYTFAFLTRCAHVLFPNVGCKSSHSSTSVQFHHGADPFPVAGPRWFGVGKSPNLVRHCLTVGFDTLHRFAMASSPTTSSGFI